jgi:hypothetical protein
MGNSPWLYEALYVSEVINEIKKLRSRLTQMSESVTVLHMLLVILKVGMNTFFPYFVLLEILLRWEWTHSVLTLCVDWNSGKPLNARLHQFNLLSLNSCYFVLLSCKAHLVFWTHRSMRKQACQWLHLYKLPWLQKGQVEWASNPIDVWMMRPGLWNAMTHKNLELQEFSKLNNLPGWKGKSSR